MKRQKKNKLNFIFAGQWLLVTDKLQIPNQNDLSINPDTLIRQLTLDFANPTAIATELPTDFVAPQNMKWMDLKTLLPLLSHDLVAQACKACQLLEWDKAHQFCGACATPTKPACNEHSRSCTNSACKRIFYPRISPVIIVAVERNQEILLARSFHFPPDIYSVLAGFIEPGESVEQSIHREVFEETGIKIKNIKYFASQSWPFPNSLMLGFQAMYESGEIICGANEIEHAAFFHVDALPKTFSGTVSISQWLLNDFYARHKMDVKK